MPDRTRGKSTNRWRQAPVARWIWLAPLFAAAAALAAWSVPADALGAGCAKATKGDGGPDRIRGSASRDLIIGRGGNDRLIGGGGGDCLKGGSGRDRLAGGGGRDRLAGGPGADTIKARGGGADLVFCGPGRDRVRADVQDVLRGCASSSARYVPKSKLGPVPADARYVSPSGSDSGPGTAASPWRTIAHAIASAGAGDTVVLRPGTYGARGVTHTFGRAGTSSAPITFRGDPSGAMPRILGHVRINGSYQRLNYLLFDGPTGRVQARTSDNPGGEQVQITILGTSVNGVEISDSEIRQSDWHAGIYADTANNARITGNYIHHNGDPADPGQDNLSHGIYFARGSGLIANNVISQNVARGIQLYEGPHDVVISNNTVVRNGKAGIQFANQTARCLAVNNIVAYNGEYGIRSSSLSGDGNAVRQNLVWGNGGNDLAPADGLTLVGNLRTHPGFGRTDGYRPPPGSAAIDRAVTSYAPVRDFDAVARPRGAAPDLGAFEAG